MEILFALVMFLVTAVIMIGVALLLVIPPLSLTAWVFGRVAMTVLAAAIIGWGIWQAIGALEECAAEPLWIDTGAGMRPEFACDGPGGFYVYFTIYFVLPVVGLLIAFVVLALWHWPAAQKSLLRRLFKGRG